MQIGRVINTMSNDIPKASKRHKSTAELPTPNKTQQKTQHHLEQERLRGMCEIGVEVDYHDQNIHIYIMLKEPYVLYSRESSSTYTSPIPHLATPSPLAFSISNKHYDFPASLTAFIHCSSPRLSKPPRTISYTCLALSAPKSLPSKVVRYATPARTSSASPSKTITSQSLVALSKLRDSVKREVKMSFR